MIKGIIDNGVFLWYMQLCDCMQAIIIKPRSVWIYVNELDLVSDVVIIGIQLSNNNSCYNLWFFTIKVNVLYKT